jgi:hypothetical protein
MTQEDEDRDVALFRKLECAIAQAIVDLKLPREEDLRVDILLHVLAKMAADYAIEDGISIDDFLAGMRGTYTILCKHQVQQEVIQ